MEQLNEKIKGLVKKAEKSGMPYSILKKVYDRGMAAWKTGHRPGTTPQQWAFARVNSFVTKSSGTWGKADKDLADKVRGAKKESIENPRKAKDLIRQVREKLGKDADAGDYIKDFRKSDAPQFKGKSDKKIRDMAIAAYLDDKDKKESIKENLLIHTKDDRVTDQLVYHLQDLQGRGRSNISDIDTDNVYRHRQGKYVKGRINVEIDGSRSDSQKLLKDLQKKYGSKIKVSLDMGEDNIQEETCPICHQDPCVCESLKLDEAVIAGKDYKYDGKGPIKISKKMYAKVQRDSKTMVKGKPYMMALNPKTQGTELVPVKFEEVDIQESGHQDVPSMKTQVQIAMDALQKMNTELGKLSDEDELPTWWTNKVATAVNKLDGMADYIDAMHDRGQQMAEEHEAILSELTEKFTKVSPQVIDKIKGMMKDPKQKESLKNIMTHLMPKEVVKMLHKEIPATKSLSEEEVDNSLMAQATRVISDTSIKEKIDPADIDMRATDADRKAADKNIIIQLRRAQDMVKQTGRQDQTGIEFLDRKKQKVDSKIINKALDMFDKMKPNDKAKMQKTIGKSYRDLLKTVQRGRI